MLARLVGALAPALPLLVFLWLKGDRRQFARYGGTVVRHAALRLGPVFVKLAQAISYRRDLLPAEFCDELIPLLDAVEYPREAKGRFCPSPAEFRTIGLTELSPTPIGSGSVAIVYRANLRDGLPVAAKIVRPWVARCVGRDLKALRTSINIVGRNRHLKHIPLVEAVCLILPIIEQQVDMHHEFLMLTRLNAAFRQPPLFPRAIEVSGTRRHILLMELIDQAVPLNSVDLDDKTYRKCALELLHALYRMIFVHGLVHCDLHPGNILVRKGQIVILDAGLTAELSDSERRVFRDLFFGLAEGNARACTTAILKSAIRRPTTLNEEAVRSDVKQLLKLHHNQPAGTFLVAALVRDLFDLQRRHGLSGAPTFIGAIWALAMFEGLVRQRYPDLDFQAEAHPYIVSALIEEARVRPVSVA